jgi:hypothetical protein
MYIFRRLLHTVHMDMIHHTDEVSLNKLKIQIGTYFCLLKAAPVNALRTLFPAAVVSVDVVSENEEVIMLCSSVR